MRSELTQQELSRLNMTQLLDYGQQALKAADYERATALFREAVHRAPMRQDLKNFLSMAVEGTLIEHPTRRGSSAPQAPPPRPQAPQRPQAPPPRPQAPQRPQTSAPPPNLPPRPEPRREELPPRPAAERWELPERRPSLPPPNPGSRSGGIPTDAEPTPRRFYESRLQPRSAPPPDSGLPSSGGRPAETEPPQRFYENRTPPRPEPRPPEPRFPGRPAARETAPWFEEAPPLERPPLPPAPRPRLPMDDGGAGRPPDPPAPRTPRPRLDLPPPAPLPARAQPPQLFKPHPRPIDFNRRHQRGPLSWILIGAFTGVLMFALLGGVAWFVLVYNKKLESGPKRIDNTADLNLAIERAKALTRKDEYSKAIDLLLAQPEAPERNRVLGEMYNEQGDQQILRQKPPRYETAMENYLTAIKFDPGNVNYRTNLADAYFQVAVSQSDDRKASDEALAKAEEQCDFMLKQDGKNLGALDILKRIAIRRRDDALLAQTLNRIIGAAPDSPRAAEARQMLEERKLR